MDLGTCPIAGELAAAFADLHRRASALKGFVAHYPRADLPGRCIGIQTVIHDLPDPMVETDGESAEQFARELRDNFGAPGMLRMLRDL